MQLKIVHKALLLIIIPLLLELGFLYKLSTALHEADNNINVQTRVGATLVYVDLVLFDVINGAAGFVLFNAFKDKHYLETAVASGASLDKHKNELSKLSAKVPHEMLDVEDFTSRVNEMNDLLTYARNIYQDNGYISSVRAMGKMKSYITRVSKAGNQLIEKQVKQGALLEEEHRQASDRLQTMIGILAAFILAVAAILAVLLGINFNRRLQILMKNTQRIAANAKLEPRLAGSDELSVLDNVIHNLSDDLADARRRKEEVLAVVSHDLRTPLSSLGLTLELMQSGALGSLNEQGTSAVSNGRTTVNSLIALINDLLEVESLELSGATLHKEPTPVDELITASVGMVSATARKKSINIKVDSVQCTADVDRTRISRVLVNLLGNAVKFSKSGSNISLSVRKLNLDSRAVIEFRVSDQGPGIPQDKLEAIFEKFQQAGRGDEGEKSGSGLGLAICKAIVEAHGGKIGVESSPGQGSSFWFHVPAAQ